MWANGGIAQSLHADVAAQQVRYALQGEGEGGGGKRRGRGGGKEREGERRKEGGEGGKGILIMCCNGVNIMVIKCPIESYWLLGGGSPTNYSNPIAVIA